MKSGERQERLGDGLSMRESHPSLLGLEGLKFFAAQKAASTSDRAASGPNVKESSHRAQALRSLHREGIVSIMASIGGLLRRKTRCALIRSAEQYQADTYTQGHAGRET